jgi:hypothetical protein
MHPTALLTTDTQVLELSHSTQDKDNLHRAESAMLATVVVMMRMTTHTVQSNARCVLLMYSVLSIVEDRNAARVKEPMQPLLTNQRSARSAY